MMNQAIVADRLSSIQSLLQGIQHEVGSGRTRHLPADNAPSKNVNHEGDIDETLSSRDLREIGYPQRIGAIGSELPMHTIQWARRGLIAHRGFDRLTAPTPCKSFSHISRSTVQRATLMPSRRNGRQTLRAP